MHNYHIQQNHIRRTAMWFLINLIFTDKHHTITSTTSNQRGEYKTVGDYKTAGRLQNKQLTLPVRLHKEMWLQMAISPGLIFRILQYTGFKGLSFIQWFKSCCFLIDRIVKRDCRYGLMVDILAYKTILHVYFSLH